MLEILAIGLLLIISIFLAVINWQIYLVTVKMLTVTIDIYVQTLELLRYTKKTYGILGGEEGLTTFPKDVKLAQSKKTQEVEDG